MRNSGCKRGFTIVEVLLVAVVLGLLAAAMFPAINKAITGKANAAAARKLHAAVLAFELYAAENSIPGTYPLDANRGTVPTEMAAYYFPYYKIDWWTAPTELGGKWDWDVGNNGIQYSISIPDPTASASQLEEFDKLIDDGNLSGGRFIKIGTRYHYILVK